MAMDREQIEKQPKKETLKEGQRHGAEAQAEQGDFEALMKDREKDPRVRAHMKLAGDIHTLVVRGYREKKDIAEAFHNEAGACDVSLDKLAAKKQTLEKARVELGKKYEDFDAADSNKNMHLLFKSFSAEERDLLLESLDNELNPIGYKKGARPSASAERTSPEDEKEDTQTHEKKVIAARAKFDEAIKSHEELRGQNPEALNLASYIYLKQERVSEAENKINAISHSSLEAQKQATLTQRDLYDYIATRPDIVEQMKPIANNPKLSEMQKLHAIDGLLSLVLPEVQNHEAGRAENGDLLKNCLSALEKYESQRPTSATELANLELQKKGDEDVLDHLKSKTAPSDQNIEKSPE